MFNDLWVEIMECKTCASGIFPHYGVAPHDCYYKIGAPIGQSIAHLPQYDPPNFKRDSEDRGCGIYYCPECLNGIENHGKTLPDQLILRKIHNEQTKN